MVVVAVRLFNVLLVFPLLMLRTAGIFWTYLHVLVRQYIHTPPDDPSIANLAVQ